MVLTALLLPAPGVANADSQPANVPVTRADLYAYQDPWLAVDPGDPGHLAVAYREADQRQVCGLSLSHDGGRTWTSEDVSGPKGRLPWPDGFTVCYEAVVAFAPDGTLYYVAQATRSFEDPYSRILIATSTDGGVGFKSPELVDPAVPAAQDRAGGDWHPRIAVNPDSGRVLVRWTRFTPRNRQGAVLVAASTGRGAPFSPPVTASPPSSADAFGINSLGASISAARDGSVYVSWLDLTHRNSGCAGAQPQAASTCAAPVPLYVAASHDGARTFDPPVAVDTQVNLGCPGANQPGTGRSACDALHFDRGPEEFSLAAGSAPGTAFLAWWDGDPPGRARVSFSASSDGGRTWSARRTVGMPEGRDADQQHRPQLAVSRGGRLDLAYYDVTPDSAQDVYWVHSEDAGAHFSTPLRLTDRPSDTGVGPLGENGVDPGVGSWLGVASTDDTLAVAWTDTRRGNRDNAKQDVYFASTPLTTTRRAVWVYVAAGVALLVVAGGAVTTALWIRRRGSRGPRS